jgi:methylated-DNA-[protein]-cysteine S-methyltransferase
MNQHMHNTIIRSTPFGPVAVLWQRRETGPVISRILISTPERPADERARRLFPGVMPSSCAAIESVAQGIADFLEGRSVAFSLDSIELDACSPFQQKVLRAEHGIPRGRVSTYSLIARHLGVPGAARAVGNALANNPFPIIIPCHRAVRSDRTLGGYQGGRAMKRALLAHEGVGFDGNGRVVVDRFHYDGISSSSQLTGK